MAPRLSLRLFAVTPDAQYLVMHSLIFQVTDHELIPVETPKKGLPLLVQQVFAMKGKDTSLSWYEKDKFAIFGQARPQFVDMPQGAELAELDQVIEQLPAEVLTQGAPFQVIASDRLLIVNTDEALWIYGIPEGREP